MNDSAPVSPLSKASATWASDKGRLQSVQHSVFHDYLFYVQKVEGYDNWRNVREKFSGLVGQFRYTVGRYLSNEFPLYLTQTQVFVVAALTVFQEP